MPPPSPPAVLTSTRIRTSTLQLDVVISHGASLDSGDERPSPPASVSLSPSPDIAHALSFLAQPALRWASPTPPSTMKLLRSLSSPTMLPITHFSGQLLPPATAPPSGHLTIIFTHSDDSGSRFQSSGHAARGSIHGWKEGLGTRPRLSERLVDADESIHERMGTGQHNPYIPRQSSLSRSFLDDNPDDNLDDNLDDHFDDNCDKCFDGHGQTNTWKAWQG
ncbi:hypothetical protein GGR57DRAFT_512559 [Xylariaceae sp. FL1272]|nr:hypothetical protein GGR57DRAFT_512559 [Xylariaceae sp. FL1272]